MRRRGLPCLASVVRIPLVVRIPKIAPSKLVCAGKDRRQDKKEEAEALGKKADKFGKKGDGKVDPKQGPDKSFTHQTCRHILVQKQSEAIRIRDEIHEGKISFNEAAFQFSEDKAGAHGLLGDKAQNEVRALA